MKSGLAALILKLIQPRAARAEQDKTPDSLALVTVDLPSPAQLRGAWAAVAALHAAYGWTQFVYATPEQWYFHDGGGNWACLRFKAKGQAVLLGHDHEYSDTYFREAAAYFQEQETDLLAGAPDWWGFNLDPQPFGEWIGFIYGWNGTGWQRAPYETKDGFDRVGLLRDLAPASMAEFAAQAPGNEGRKPDEDLLKALIAADGNLTHEMLEKAVPGWNTEAGLEAAAKFLQADV